MHKLAHVAGLLFATIFGFTFMFSKVVMDRGIISPIGLIAYRFLVAILVFEILRLTRIVKIQFHRNNLYQLGLVALFQPILYFLTETYGLSRTSSSEAGMMIALIPIFVAILSAIILKEKPKKIQTVFIILSVSGVLFIQLFKYGEGLDLEILGFLLLLAAVLSAAMFSIVSRKASLSLRPQELTYFMMLSGAVVFNSIYVIQLGVQGNINQYFIQLVQIDTILPILYLGVIASIGGFFLVNFALSKLPAHVTSIYANLSTIVAILAGALILSETLYYYHFIGAAMIILGVYGTIYFNNKKITQHIEHLPKSS